MMRPLFLPRVDSYFAKAYASLILLSFLAMVGLVIVTDAFQNLDEFSRYARRSGAGWDTLVWLLFQYYLSYPITLVVIHMLPMVLMLAATIAVTTSSLYNEYTALRASGVSLQRAIMPIFLLALAVGLVVFFSRDAVIPWLVRKYHAVNSLVRPKSAMPLALPIRDGNTIQTIVIGHFDSKKKRAYNLHIEIRDFDSFQHQPEVYTAYTVKEARLEPRKDAPSDDPHQLQWVPEPDQNGRVLHQGYYRQRSTPWTDPLPTLVTAAMLERQVMGEAVMTWKDLRLLADEVDMRIETHLRFSAPWVGLVLLLLGLSLVLHVTANVAQPSYIQNISIAILVCAGFYILRLMFLSLGEREILPPILATWLPNLIVGGVGLWFFLRL